MAINWDQTAEHALELGTVYLGRVAGAVVIIIVGRYVARFVRALIGRALARVKVEATAVSFISNIAYWIVVAFVASAVLSNFGIQTASFVAMLGAAGFAVGLAFQGALSNFAAGMMILLFKPFVVGDRVEAQGVTGIVEGIDLFTTIIRADGGVQAVVPNGKLYGDVIRNHSAYSRSS